jgi:hypothetical protein
MASPPPPPPPNTHTQSTIKFMRSNKSTEEEKIPYIHPLYIFIHYTYQYKILYALTNYIYISYQYYSDKRGGNTQATEKEDMAEAIMEAARLRVLGQTRPTVVTTVVSKETYNTYYSVKRDLQETYACQAKLLNTFLS